MTRRRYIYTRNGRPLDEPIEVSDDWNDAPRALVPVTDLYMDGLQATDGTDIGSRKKRNAYMKANNLADADDFKGTWEKAAKERAEFFQGRPSRERRELIERIVHTQRKR